MPFTGPLHRAPFTIPWPSCPLSPRAFHRATRRVVQVTFFAYLNLELDAEQLRKIASDMSPPLVAGQPASWHDLLRIYAFLSQA